MANTRYPDLGLDLSFHPIRQDAPSTLSREQIEIYNDTGYIAGVTIGHGAELKALRRRFLEAAPEELGPLNPHARLSWVHDIAAGAAVQGYVQDLLGPDVVCFISSFIDKEPGSPREVPGHQDAAFNAMDARSLIVWLAIDDADEENGAMWFCPGSHKLGALDVRDASGDLNLKDALVQQVVKSHGRVPIPLRSGQAVVFSDLLLHISPPNRSPRHRRALTMTFASASQRPFVDPRSKQAPVLCAGSDQAGNWQLLPRPG